MDNWTWTMIASAILCVCLYWHFKKQLAFFEERRISYIPGWPFLGNMVGPFFGKKHLIETIEEAYNTNQDAKYVGFFDFSRPTIVLRDPELIKIVTIKNFDHFPNHRQVVDEKIEPLFANNLFNITGDKWREARNLLSPAFTSSKIRAMSELACVCAKNFVRHLLKSKQLDMVSTKDLFARYTNDVIATCAYGISVNSLENPDNDFYVLGKAATKLDGLQTVKFFVARMAPWLLKLLDMKFVDKRASAYFRNVIASTVAMRDEKGIKRQDMLQLMLDARSRDAGSSLKHLKLDVDEMTSQAFIFFFAGFDTTSTQMCVLAHELAINPVIQARLQAEIDECYRNGKNNKDHDDPGYDTINALPYLDAVFNESMRRHSQIAFLDRVCVKEFELPPALPGNEPFIVTPGTGLFVPLTAIHKDPKYFADPLKFDPDRYYRKKITINDVNNLGFGIGPRSCIGNRFAIMEIKVLLFYLLAKFHLKPNSKTCNPLRYSKKSFILKAEGGFWLTLEPRK